MNKYLIEYEKRNLMSPENKLSGPYKFNISAESLEQAAIITTNEIFRIGMKSSPHDVWNAHIMDSSKGKYVILKDGGWLIDFKTGKLLEKKEDKKVPLEKRI
jgi:hypothetical protein